MVNTIWFRYDLIWFSVLLPYDMYKGFQGRPQSVPWCRETLASQMTVRLIGIGILIWKRIDEKKDLIKRCASLFILKRIVFLVSRPLETNVIVLTMYFSLLTEPSRGISVRFIIKRKLSVRSCSLISIGKWTKIWKDSEQISLAS